MVVYIALQCLCWGQPNYFLNIAFVYIPLKSEGILRLRGALFVDNLSDWSSIDQYFLKNLQKCCFFYRLCPVASSFGFSLDIRSFILQSRGTQKVSEVGWVVPLTDPEQWVVYLRFWVQNHRSLHSHQSIKFGCGDWTVAGSKYLKALGFSACICPGVKAFGKVGQPDGGCVSHCFWFARRLLVWMLELRRGEQLWAQKDSHHPWWVLYQLAWG